MALAISTFWLIGCGERSERPTIPGTLEAPCALDVQHYRIDQIGLPSTAADVGRYGHDLDGDPNAWPDNAAASALSLLEGHETPSGTALEDLQAAVADKIDDGRLHWILEVARCADEPNPHVRVRSRAGVDSGSGGINLLPDEDAIPAVGALNGDGGFRGDTGFGLVPISALADFLDTESTVEWVPADALAVELGLDGEGRLFGSLGAAVGPDGVDIIRRLLAEFFSRQLESESSEYARETLDTNGDGRISMDEMHADPLMTSVLAYDVDLWDESEPDRPIFWPLRDRVDDRFSLGIAIRAAPIAIE